jgi:hypothetical protein
LAVLAYNSIMTKMFLILAALAVACSGFNEGDSGGIDDGPGGEAGLPQERASVTGETGGAMTSETTADSIVGGSGTGGTSEVGVGGYVEVSRGGSGVGGSGTDGATYSPENDPCGEGSDGRSRWVEAAGECLKCPPGWYDCDHQGIDCEYYSAVPGFVCRFKSP